MQCPRCGRRYEDPVPLRCACGASLGTGMRGTWNATVELPPPIVPQGVDAPTITGTGASIWSEGSATVWMTNDATTPYAGQARTSPPPPPSMVQRGAWRWQAVLSVVLVGLAIVLLVAAVGLAQQGGSAPRTRTSAGVSKKGSTATATASPTQTVTSTPLPVGDGVPIIGWQQNAGCTIQNGTLIATNTGSENGSVPCLSPDPPQQDSRIQVNATFLSAENDAIGIAFRVTYQGPMLNDDEIYLSSSGMLFGKSHVDGGEIGLLDQRHVHIATGQGATNTLTVVAQGAQITIYVNGRKVATTIDSNNLNVQGNAGVVVWQPGQQGAFRGWSVEPLDGGPLPGG